MAKTVAAVAHNEAGGRDDIARPIAGIDPENDAQPSLVRSLAGGRFARIIRARRFGVHARAPGEAAAYFQAAAWHQGLFDAFVALSALLIVAVWVILYGKAHGMRLLLPDRFGAIYTRVYVACLSGLYVEDALQVLARTPKRMRVRRHRRRE